MSRPCVLISGASSGIGKATALSLASRGWTVVAGVRTEQDAHHLRDAHVHVRPVTLDVTQQGDIERAMQSIADLVGETGLQGLINNAGLGYIAPVEEIPIEDFKYNFEVNIFGLLALTQAALPLLKRSSPPGRIINVGSLAGLCTLPYAASYFASKYALESLSDSLRIELRPSGIDVSLVRPGPVQTDIFAKAARFGRDLLELKGDRVDASSRRGMETLARSAIEAGKSSKTTDQTVRVITRALTETQPNAYYFDSWETAVQARVLAWFPAYLLDLLIDRFFHSENKTTKN